MPLFFLSFFASLVWDNLVKANGEFFNKYRISLALSKQIETFNSLLEEQAKLMNELSQCKGSPPTAGTC